MIMDLRESAKVSPRDNLSSADVLSMVSICLDDETATELKHFIGSTPFVRLRTERRNYLGEDDLFFEVMPESVPEICLIDFDQDRRSAILTAERIHEKLPGTAIFAISSNAQPDLIIQAMRCGCSEYIVKPADRDQLLEAVVRVGGRKREKRELLNGAVLTFLGGKGGSGVTTIATHVGALLARSSSKRALFIDLHSACGDAALHLGLTKHQYHFHELAEAVDRLDAELLQSFVLRHPSGLDVLPAPDLTEPGRRLQPEAIGQTIDFIRLRYDFVLIDCAPGLSEENLEVIRRSDQLYLVTVPEVSAVRNIARYLDYLGRMQFPSEKVRVVLNRHAKRSAITDDEIEKAIRTRLYWKVPNQYNQVIRTINAGDPSSQLSNSEVARSLKAWAEDLGSKSNPVSEKRKPGKGLLGLLGR